MTSDFENSVTSCQIFVVSTCMLQLSRPSSEVVREGRILNLIALK